MKVDAIVSVELMIDVPKFYPISLSTPLPLIICGGVRLIEQAYLRLRSLLGLTEIDLIQVVRPHLSLDWSRVIPRLLTEEIVDVDLRLITISFSDLEDILTKYDTVIILPATAVPERAICVVSTKNLDLRATLSIAEQYAGRKVNAIYELIKLNVELVRETLQLLGVKGGMLNIESNVDSSVRIEEPCILYRCDVRPFTYIRSGTVVYPKSIVGGELKNSIVEAFAHKEHYGYLGDSYIGRFVNLGAGTTTSNLKNTRGTIKYLGVDTGMRKLGAIIGDFAKTAIGTYIYSGKCIGSYSHVYHVVPIDVPPCTIYRDGTLIRMRLDKLIQFIERDCAKYPTDVELEKRIAISVYYSAGILQKSSPQDLAFKLK